MAINENKTIGFLRGTQAQLADYLSAASAAGHKAAVDGTFYLTVDEGKASRLYVGQGDKLVPVNEGIITVSNVAGLTSLTAVQPGDFAYATDENILCVYSGQGWVQINNNTNTTNAQLGIEVTTNDNQAKVEIGITDSTGTEVKDDFTVKGANGVTVSNEGKVLTITGDATNIAASVADGVATVSAKTDGGTEKGKFTVESGNNNVTIGGEDGKITISTKNAKIATVEGANNTTAGFDVTVTDSEANEATGTIDPIIVYGDGEGKPEVHFVGGKATLDIYTKTQIDDKLKTLDAVTYRGTVGQNGTAAASVNAITEAHNGDAFKVVGLDAKTGDTLPAAKSNSGEDVAIRNGDLLIAVGTEGADGKLTDIKFDVIPSGNDIDTTYSVEGDGYDNGLALIRSTDGNVVGSLKIAAGDKMTVSQDGNSANKVVTVGHADVTTSDEEETAVIASAVGNTDITVVTGYEVDGKGHITKVKTTKVTLKDTNAVLESVEYAATATNNVATVTQTTTLTNGKGTSADQSGAFSVTSDNMAVTANDKQVKVNFEWGTF